MSDATRSLNDYADGGFPNEEATTVQPADGNQPLNEHSAILDAALDEFSEVGFNDARLETIASASGISKRMVHYYYGDKKGLYYETLRYASSLLRPTEKELHPDTNVPVQSIKDLVVVLVNKFFDEPRAARLIAIENLIGILPKETEHSIFGQSPVVLQIDKLLMHGQDFGAFRPGVSAIDIYLLVYALSSFPVYNQYTFKSMYGVAVTDPANREGLILMIQDVVISFLTTTMSTDHGDSYTVTTAQSRAMESLSSGDPYSPLSTKGSQTPADDNPAVEADPAGAHVTNRFDEEFGPLSGFYQD